MNDADRRKLWRQWLDRSGAVHRAWAATGYRYPPPCQVPMPAELRGLKCGARTRAGTPCKRRDIYASGRCKLHGGLSTGPRTDAGKSAASANARKRSP
jgi:hypothetical protein